MPDFKFRNLTVKVGDELKLCAPDTKIQGLTPLLCRRFYTNYCYNFSRWCDWGTRFPTYTITNCRAGSLTIPTCGISEEPTWGPEVDVDVDLNVLKEQLTEQLKAVEAEQAKVAAAAKPATVEEADALKAELQAAMDELDAHRAELAKGEGA